METLETDTAIVQDIKTPFRSPIGACLGIKTVLLFLSEPITTKEVVLYR